MKRHPQIVCGSRKAVLTLAAVVAAALAATLDLPATAATAAAMPSPITRQQIATALAGQGVAVSAEQVTLLNDVVAATRSPELRVESLERLDVHQARVRLACAAPADCVPFFVIVHSDAALPSTLPGVAATPHTPAVSPVVRAGAPAVLLIESDHVHIRLHVVCLENGARGQTIRVATPDRKQTFTAQVMDDAKLRGSLQ